MSEAWEKFESYIRILTGGKKTPGSGRLGIKGDVQTETLLIECKQRSCTKGVWISPVPDWFDTVVYQAKKAEKIPILAYQLTYELIPSRVFLFCRKEDFDKLAGDNPLLCRPSGITQSPPEGWILLHPEELARYCREFDQTSRKEKKDETKSRGGFTPGKRTLPKRPFRKHG